MANISYITTGENPAEEVSLAVPMDESIGALLIDISGWENPFSGYPKLYNSFGNNKVQRITCLDDASMFGIVDNDFLEGLLYYHVSQFYKYIGENQPLYIMLADCSKDWDAIFTLQQESTGEIFQVGVWTHQNLWAREDGKITFSPLVYDIQREADEINGVVGQVTTSATPLNIILFPNTNLIDGEPYDYRYLPDATELNCPKISVVVAQNGTSKVHQMQSKLPGKTPVGTAGLFLACLAICGAERSIASTKNCDLNKNEDFTMPEWGFGKNYLPIDSIDRYWANVMSQRGYIIPIDYEALEGQYFFSSDQTLSNGDYRSISTSRVIHKCRRVVRTVLYPFVNASLPVDSNGRLSAVSASRLQDSVYALLDSVMLNMEGQSQITTKSMSIIDNDILENDSLAVELRVTPANSSESISEQVSGS